MEACLLSKPNSGATRLVVACSSYGDHGNPPGFEWVNLLTDQAVNLLWLRDPLQHWYLGGLPEIGDLQASAEFVREFAQGQHVTITGSSMGGFGALLYGALIQADEVVAFAPQTNLTEAWMAGIDDQRWPVKMREVREAGYSPLDLQPLFEHSRPKRTRIYYDSASPHAVRDAARLAAYAELTDVGEGHHECAYTLARTGRMLPLLDLPIQP
jgi:hypothetical protein